MAQLKIRYFGPIKDGNRENNGFINITPVTIIIGNQASGKSVIAKLYFVLSSLEKNLYNLYNRKSYISFTEEFMSYLKKYGLEEYLKENTYIEYIGEAFHFIYENSNFITIPLDTNLYIRPKIMYIPSTRNLVSVLEDVEIQGKLPPFLSIFLDVYKVALKTLAITPFDLPIPNYQIRLSEDWQTTKVLHNNSYFSLCNASSGIQSIIPLILVSHYLCHEVNEASSKKSAISNQCFINIIEEPEQNLYPDSQGNVLSKLLEYNNMTLGNHLVITTHSPYILFYVTLAVEVWDLVQKNVPLEKIDKVINSKSSINPVDLNIYEIFEDGTINQLEKKDILPSDEDLLNNAIEELDNKFAKLLELEDEYSSATKSNITNMEENLYNTKTIEEIRNNIDLSDIPEITDLSGGQFINWKAKNNGNSVNNDLDSIKND